MEGSVQLALAYSDAPVTDAADRRGGRANCTDPSITWYRKWQDAEAAGGVTYVKGTGNLPANHPTGHQLTERQLVRPR